MIYINKTIFNDLIEIDDNIARKIYTEAVLDINLNKLKCCQKDGGSFTVHGYYSRKLKIKNKLVSLPIIRVKCEFCGKTHAILFKDFIPYSRFRTEEVHQILKNKIDEDFSFGVIERIKRIKRQIIARLKILGLSIIDDTSKLLIKSIQDYCVHFLQIHRGKIVSILLESG